MGYIEGYEMKEASWYLKQPDEKVECRLCPQHCVIAPGKKGICRGRENKGGILYSSIYGYTIPPADDPVEKKPLYHFYPGRNILSIGANACNLSCDFCQNWHLSQDQVTTNYYSPEKIAALATKSNSLGVAFTYSEPLVWFEYIMDCAPLLHQRDLKVVLVSNGTILPAPFQELLPHIDAMNIDLKSMSEDFYKKYCHGSLPDVLRTIELASSKTHVEITNLLIPTLNDSDEDIQALVDWIANLDPEIPLHFSRYFPHFKMDLPPTSRNILEKARHIALKKLKYIYVGNIVDRNLSSTFCPNEKCGKMVLQRDSYFVSAIALEGDQCGYCGTKIRLVGTPT